VAWEFFDTSEEAQAKKYAFKCHRAKVGLYKFIRIMGYEVWFRVKGLGSLRQSPKSGRLD
jgi:hypothetical protein